MITPRLPESFSETKESIPTKDSTKSIEPNIEAIDILGNFSAHNKYAVKNRTTGDRYASTPIVLNSPAHINAPPAPPDPKLAKSNITPTIVEMIAITAKVSSVRCLICFLVLIGNILTRV